MPRVWLHPFLSPPSRAGPRGRRATLVLTLAALAGCGAWGAATVPDPALRGEIPEPRATHEARVVRVVDGDTVVLTGLGSSRLIGVDTPEVYGGAECYGREASAFARRVLTPGKRTHFVRGVERRDRYGRPLVYLWLDDGRSFNGMLVEGGYATTLTIPPNDRYAHRLRALALEARRAGRGQWSRGACRGPGGR